MSWNTANDAVLAEGQASRVLIDGPHRFDGVRVRGVDERRGRHRLALSDHLVDVDAGLEYTWLRLGQPR